MRLEDLRNLLMSERESGRLVEVPPDLFDGALARIRELEREAIEDGNPLSERTHALVEEIFSIRETLQDIFQIRVRKILSLALTSLEIPEEREELKKMHPAELEMYRTIVGALGSCRRDLLEAGRRIESTAAGESPPTIAAAGSPNSIVRSSEGECEWCTVRIMKDIEPFLGVDGRVYHLKKEDLVCLPRLHAEILCKGDIALNINHGT